MEKEREQEEIIEKEDVENSEIGKHLLESGRAQSEMK